MADSQFRIAENLWQKSGKDQKYKQYIIEAHYSASTELAATCEMGEYAKKVIIAGKRYKEAKMEFPQNLVN